jgi:cardiolipin synthase
MVVDSSWCTVGTANLDYRSFNLNLEINLVSRCVGLTELLAAQFEFDMTRSELVDPAQWHNRPGWRSALEAVAWRLRRWL